MDLVDEDDGSVRELPELVLGVDEEEPSLGCLRLPEGKELLGGPCAHLEGENKRGVTWGACQEEEGAAAVAAAAVGGGGEGSSACL